MMHRPIRLHNIRLPLSNKNFRILLDNLLILIFRSQHNVWDDNLLCIFRCHSAFDWGSAFHPGGRKGRYYPGCACPLAFNNVPGPELSATTWKYQSVKTQHFQEEIRYLATPLQVWEVSNCIILREVEYKEYPNVFGLLHDSQNSQIKKKKTTQSYSHTTHKPPTFQPPPTSPSPP